MNIYEEIKRLNWILTSKCKSNIVFGPLPDKGCPNILYVYNGNFYTWNGTTFIEVGTEFYNFLPKQSFEPYNVNPPIPLLTSDNTSFERYLDAHYMYVQGTNEHRIYFLCFAAAGPSIQGGGLQYRYCSSFDEGKTWTFDPTITKYFTALGSGDEVELYENVIYQLDATNWRMYYQAKDAGGIYRTKLATSNDAGLTWVRQGVVLDVGTVGQWDSHYAGLRNIIKLPDGTYYAAYQGRNSTSAVFNGGAATSIDGLTWTKIGKVVEMESGLYPWEGSNGLINCVQYIDGVYYMMYGTKGVPDIQNTNRYIGITISTDGINYTKYENNPIIDLSEYLVNTPGSWNYGTEDFIGWEKHPTKEGYYNIITRGRPVYPGSGPVNWNFGLYWFGNRINSDDIIDATLVNTDLNLVKRLGEDIVVDLSSLQDWINDGKYYASIKATGTALQNGAELLAKVAQLELDAIQPMTLIVPPGTYDLDGSVLEISLDSFTLTSINGENNVNIIGTVTLNEDRTSLIGIKADVINFTGPTKTGLLFKNCIGGVNSFTVEGITESFSLASSTFENCIADMGSFLHVRGSETIISATDIKMINCKSTDYSFFYNTASSGFITATDILIDGCTGTTNCFFVTGESATFNITNINIKNCKGSDESYLYTVTSGNTASYLSINNSIGGNACFGRGIAFDLECNFDNIVGGEACMRDCTSIRRVEINNSYFGDAFLANSNMDATINNTIIESEASVDADLAVNFIYCHYRAGSFPTYGVNRTRYCLNSNFTTDNQN